MLKIQRWYVINFYSSGRTIMTTKWNLMELLEIRTSDLENLYEVNFSTKGSKLCEDIPSIDPCSNTAEEKHRRFSNRKQGNF